MTQALYTLFKRLFLGAPARVPSKRHTGVKKIEVTIRRFLPEPVEEIAIFDSGAAALSWLGMPADIDCLIEVSTHENDWSMGDFCLWCSGDFACARIGEHREHNARHPDSAFAVGEIVNFKDDDGSIFAPPQDLVLPRKLAMEALHAWLSGQERPDMLLWD